MPAGAVRYHAQGPSLQRVQVEEFVFTKGRTVMKKIQVHKMSARQLDFFVARADGHRPYYEPGHPEYFDYVKSGNSKVPYFTPRYSTCWSQGGWIIEREKIDIKSFSDSQVWKAYCQGSLGNYFAITPLMAAMRAYVGHVYGEKIDLSGHRPAPDDSHEGVRIEPKIKQTVWVVQMNSYDNGGIEGVFSSEENAKLVEEYINKNKGDCQDIAISFKIEIDYGIEEIKQGFREYRITVCLEGKILRVDDIDFHYSDQEKEITWKRWDGEFCTSIDVWAMDKQHAIEIARENIKQLMASNRWD